MTRLRDTQRSSLQVDASQSGIANAGANARVAGTPVTLAQNVAHAARVFGTIFGVLGAAAIANALTAGVFNSTFGLIPRTSSHAWGILLHPLLHANGRHLGVNAIGILILGGLVFMRQERDFWRVTALGILVGGSATWLLGRSDLHVGASGVVFAYLGYLLTTGWFDRKIGAIVLSLGVAAVWGSALFGLSPFQQGISWELHLFGLIGGIAGAWWRKHR